MVSVSENTEAKSKLKASTRFPRPGLTVSDIQTYLTTKSQGILALFL